MSSLALNYLVNLLARRDYSQFEIQQKMQEKAFSEEEIEQALAHCQQKNWQSDLRFAINYIRYRSQRGYGALRIKQELQQLKGVASEVIQQALEQTEIDWDKLAFELLRKKMPTPMQNVDPKTKQKIYRYMFSHGFSAEQFAPYLGKNTFDEDFADYQ